MAWIRYTIVVLLAFSCWTVVGSSALYEKGPGSYRSWTAFEQADISEEYLVELYGQDPEEFRQLAINESNNRDDAVSWAGAIGRRQVMLPTAQDLFGTWVTKEDLHDSTFNAFTSIVELDRLEKYWSGQGYTGDALKILKYSSYYQGISGASGGVIVNYSQAIIERKTRLETHFVRHREEKVPLRSAVKRLKG